MVDQRMLLEASAIALLTGHNDDLQPAFASAFRDPLSALDPLLGCHVFTPFPSALGMWSGARGRSRVRYWRWESEGIGVRE